MMGRKCRWIVPAVLVIVTAGCDTAAYTVTERNEWRAAEEVILSEEIEDIDFDLTVFIENSWISQESGEEYHFTEIFEGEKRADGESVSFYYECGRDEQYRDLLYIRMDDTDEESLYELSLDETCYGIVLEPLYDSGEKMTLLPFDVEFLDLSDERVDWIPGTWKCGKDIYVFTENYDMISQSTGFIDTFAVVQREGGEHPEIRFRSDCGDWRSILSFECIWTEDIHSMELVCKEYDMYRYWSRIESDLI